MARCIVCNRSVKEGNFFCDDCLKEESGGNNIQSIEDILKRLDEIDRATLALRSITKDKNSGT